jgi:hypothetical protein
MAFFLSAIGESENPQGGQTDYLLFDIRKSKPTQA